MRGRKRLARLKAFSCAISTIKKESPNEGTETKNFIFYLPFRLI